MNNYDFNDSFDEFYPDNESIVDGEFYDEFTDAGTYEEVGESGDLERRRFLGRRRRYVPYSTYSRSIRSLNGRISKLQGSIKRLSGRYGVPSNLAKKLKQIEGKLAQTQQFQTLQPLLGIPKLESLTFEGETAKNVEKTVYDNDSLLLPLLLGGGNLGGLNLGGSGQNNLLPLLLLGNNGLGGDGDNSQLLLFLLLFSQNS